MFKSLVLVAALAAGTCALPAAAADVEQVRGEVRVSDLDFTRAGDIARFERRLQATARTLCEAAQTGSRLIPAWETDCRDTVIASGRERLPVLVAQAREREGRRLAAR